jgi:hypothetical protein
MWRRLGSRVAAARALRPRCRGGLRLASLLALLARSPFRLAPSHLLWNLFLVGSPLRRVGADTSEGGDGFLGGPIWKTDFDGFFRGWPGCDQGGACAPPDVRPGLAPRQGSQPAPVIPG